MKILISIILFAWSSQFLVAQSYADYNTSLDLEQYRTFSFLGWHKKSDQLISSFEKEQFIESVTEELTSRGLTFRTGTGGSLLLSYYIISEEEEEYLFYAEATGLDPAERINDGSGLTTTLEAEPLIRPGTLILDAYDRRTMGLVWQGIVTDAVELGSLTSSYHIQQRIRELMKNFPVN